MFPVDKRTVQSLWLAAPDAIPSLCAAIDEVPIDLWRQAASLDELADSIAPYLASHGARKWDFLWSMERHFSEPYGPLPKARQTFMAGIPDMFLKDGQAGEPAAATPKGSGVLAEQAHLNRVHRDGTAACAYQYDVGSEMPPEYREWLEKLFFAHGECMIPYFGDAAKDIKSMYQEADASLMAQAPDASSRLRFNNFANEEYRHTFQFYRLYSDYAPTLPHRIYEQEQQVFRAYMDIKTDGSWIDYAIFNLLGDRLGTYQAFEWVQSSYAPLARVALKVVKDERGHCNMGYVHVRDFIERSSEDRAHVQQRIDNHFYPFHLAAFGSGTSKNNEMWRKWSLKQHTNDELRAAYHAEMTLVLDSLGLKVPNFDDAYERGVKAAQKARQAVKVSPVEA